MNRNLMIVASIFVVVGIVLPGGWVIAGVIFRKARKTSTGMFSRKIMENLSLNIIYHI